MSNTVFLVPLRPEINEQQLRDLFAPFGEVVAVRRPIDRETGAVRNFAFVSMGTPEQAQAAIRALHGTLINNERVTARPATENRNVPQEPRKPFMLILPQKVLIDNLPPNTTDDELRELLSEFGELRNIRHIPAPEGSDAPHSASVTLSDSLLAREVLERVHGYEYNGYQLEVRYIGRSREQSLEFVSRVETMPVIPPTTPEKRAFATQVAEKLGETEAKPLLQIRRLVDFFGEEQVQKWLDETLTIESNGGLMLPDNSRRRTVGGVFFLVARNAIEEPLRSQIFPRNYVGRVPGSGRPEDNLPPFEWTERADLLRSLEAEAGSASTVKTTVIGRPTRVDDRNPQYVIVTVDSTLDNKMVPRGVPRPSAMSTRYLLFVGTKQWRRVNDALRASKTDRLICEGVPSLERQDAVVVYVTLATTVEIESARRDQQRAESQKSE